MSSLNTDEVETAERRVLIGNIRLMMMEPEIVPAPRILKRSRMQSDKFSSPRCTIHESTSFLDLPSCPLSRMRSVIAAHRYSNCKSSRGRRARLFSIARYQAAYYYVYPRCPVHHIKFATHETYTILPRDPSCRHLSESPSCANATQCHS